MLDAQSCLVRPLPRVLTLYDRRKAFATEALLGDSLVLGGGC
jgi:hypothetical protein